MARLPACLILALAPAFGQSSPAPQTPGFSWDDRLRQFTHRSFGWQRLTILAAETGFEHAINEPKEWGREPESYAVRYSALYGRRLVRNSIELGLGAALGEDTRYRPSGQTGLARRLRFALHHAMLTADGRIARSRLVATAGGVVVSSTWYPGGLSGSQILEGLAYGYLGQLENSLLAEFGADMKSTARRLQRRVFRRGRQDTVPAAATAP
jgi:hypothetical protein